MDQRTFADLEYDDKKRKTRRERFLERMDGLIPWERLEDRIRPIYPKRTGCFTVERRECGVIVGIGELASVPSIVSGVWTGRWR